MLKRIFKSYDYSLIAVYLLISIFGLVMVYSSSMVTAVQVYSKPSTHFFDKQIGNLVFAIIAFLIVSFIPYKIYKSNKILVPVVVLSLGVLLSLYVVGSVFNNAQSWLLIGVRSIQPSEFIKISVIIYLAAVYAKKQSYITDFNKAVAPPLVYLILVSILIAVQPDIGTATIVFLIGCTIILCSGIGWKNISRLVLIGLLIAVICSPIVIAKKDVIFTENRLGRLYSFMDPFAYEQTEGMQVVNSLLAIGSGGWSGVGLGKSVQKLGYLPHAHTDFIMAIIAEELGIFGVSFVLICLGYIVLKGFYVGMKCRDPFGSLLAFGISGMIGIQTFVNLGGISGLIPITGVTLPFISYGGSSLLSLSIALGLLVNISMFTNYEYRYKLNKQQKGRNTTLTKTV